MWLCATLLGRCILECRGKPTSHCVTDLNTYGNKLIPISIPKLQSLTIHNLTVLHNVSINISTIPISGTTVIKLYVCLQVTRRKRRRSKTTWKKWLDKSGILRNILTCVVPLQVGINCKEWISKCMEKIQIPWQSLYTGYYRTLW